ncbi:unnamed protein product, partial [Staurois parvus]
SGLQVWPVLTAPPRSWHLSIVRSLLCSPVLSAGVACPRNSVRPLPSIACLLGPVGTLYDVLYLQSLVISCTVSAVSGHLLYCVRSLWSSPVLSLQSLVISCTMSAVSGHLLYYVCSPLVQNIFFLVFRL